MSTISICITNYNQAQFFKTAIESLLNQSHNIDKIFIVDDASTDDSVKVINRILSNISDNRIIKLFRETNGGLPVARNTAIEVCDTDYIGFLDVDDWYYPDKVKKSVEVLDKYPEVGMVYSDYDMYDVKSNQMTREFKYAYDMRMLQQQCIISTNSVMRMDLFKKVGLYNPEYRTTEDYELWMRAMHHFLGFHIPEALFCYRLHGGNLTITHRDDIMRRTQHLIQNQGS